jgi:hypothetical protein
MEGPVSCGSSQRHTDQLRQSGYRVEGRKPSGVRNFGGIYPQGLPNLRTAMIPRPFATCEFDAPSCRCSISLARAACGVAPTARERSAISCREKSTEHCGQVRCEAAQLFQVHVRCSLAETAAEAARADFGEINQVVRRTERARQPHLHLGERHRSASSVRSRLQQPGPRKSPGDSRLRRRTRTVAREPDYSAIRTPQSRSTLTGHRSQSIALQTRKQLCIYPPCAAL